jgi:asparagine synthase (glutamine-hydrolysing)
MCGIVFVYCKNDEKHILAIRDSFKLLKNRGPDSGKFIKDGKVIVGFKRLAINDNSDKGMQPFSQENIKVVCNGEIYNHKELEETYGIKCESTSDCECILHLYKKIGFKEMINALRGDFAVVIYDGENVYFGRDRIGVRPLFSGRTLCGNIAFASYARCLSKYCTNIVQIKPGFGCYNEITDSIIFNDYKFVDLITHKLDYTNDIHDTLYKAVKVRTMSDRPIGCLLSGGLDSSLITSILCAQIGSHNVRTYSIGLKDSIDLKYAKMVASKLETHHTEVIFTPEQGFKAIPHVIKDLESYDITTIRASVGMWLLAKWISRNTNDKVLLSGEGSDELFCGYLYFHYAPITDELKEESNRLIKNLYLYDVLRADRCISSHGLELRVPFLDHDMIDLCMSIPGEILKPFNGVEKYILRESFVSKYNLPENVLWRRKDGMSDGISGNDKKWSDYIKDYVDEIISDKNFDKDRFPSKEAQFYRIIYDSKFPTYQPVYDYWLPKWVDHGGDPSGRLIDVFNKKIDKD